MNKQPKQLMATAWKPGQSGNPAGRPIGARQKISEKLLADLAVVWETEGESVLRRLAIEDPGKLAQIAYGLLPRDVFISVEQRTPGNLDPDEWAILRRVIDLKNRAPVQRRHVLAPGYVLGGLFRQLRRGGRECH